MLAQVPEPIVLFVDEIDSTLKLSFTDDFFAAIRYVYNARATIKEFARLSFVLLGVATPSQLIRDPDRTPFNIGKRVELTDFTFDDALPLATALNLPEDNTRQVLGWVLGWTGGHPYLTQRLFRALQLEEKATWTEADVDETVAKEFLGQTSGQDSNLLFVLDMLTRRAPKDKEADVLRTYRDVLSGPKPVRDEKRSVVKSHLKLAGIVREEDSILRVRNRIYATVYDEKWVEDHFPINWRKRVQYAAIGLTLMLLLISIPTTIFALTKWNEAEKNAQQLKQAYGELEQANGELKQAKQNLEAALDAAEVARQSAETNFNEAREAQAAEQGLRKKAENLKRLADMQSQRLKIQGIELARERDNANSGQLAARADALLTIDPVASLEMIIDRNLDGKQVKETKDTDAVLRSSLVLSHFRKFLGGQGAIKLFSDDGKKILIGEKGDRVSIYGLEPDGNPTKLGDFVLPIFEKITSLAISRNGNLALSATDSGKAYLWELPASGNAKELSGHEAQISTATFSSDGKWALTASKDKTARLWETSTGRSLALRGHEGPVFAAAFSPDGKHVVTASKDGTAMIWNVPDKIEVEEIQNTYKLVHPIDPKTRMAPEVLTATFSPDNLLVVTACDNGSAYVWDPNSGALKEKLSGHTSAVVIASFSSDGKRLVTASRDTTARVWNVEDWSSVVLAGHTDDVLSADFSHDNNLVITASQDNTARIWDVSTGENITILRGHHKRVTNALFSFDDKSAITVSDDNTARLWDVTVGRSVAALANHKPPVYTAKFSQDSTNVLTTSDDNAVRVWDAHTGAPTGVVLQHNRAVFDASFSPNGQLIVTASEDGIARIWNARSGSPLLELLGLSAVKSASFSPDNQLVVTASEDGFVRIWESQTGKPGRISEFGQFFDKAIFTPDGRFVVTSSSAGDASVWDARKSDESQSLVAGGQLGINSRDAFTRDGKYVITVNGLLAKVWEVKSGKGVHTYPDFSYYDSGTALSILHEDVINTAAISPDGTLVVTASKDNTAKVWNFETGRLVSELRGHTDNVKSAVFSPYGNLVLTASSDGTAQLWDALTGRNLLVLRGNKGEILNASFSPDGRLIITAGRDEAARLYACEVCVSAEKLKELADKRRVPKKSS